MSIAPFVPHGTGGPTWNLTRCWKRLFLSKKLLVVHHGFSGFSTRMHPLCRVSSIPVSPSAPPALSPRSPLPTRKRRGRGVPPVSLDAKWVTKQGLCNARPAQLRNSIGHRCPHLSQEAAQQRTLAPRSEDEGASDSDSDTEPSGGSNRPHRDEANHLKECPSCSGHKAFVFFGCGFPNTHDVHPKPSHSQLGVLAGSHQRTYSQ